MNLLLLAATPATGGWTPACGIVMIVCNIVAIALGKAKTDKLDAQVIARFAQSVKPEPLPLVKPEAQQLAALRRRRQQLVAMQVAEKNRLSRATEIVKADIEEHLEQIEQRLQSLNQQILT